MNTGKTTFLAIRDEDGTNETLGIWKSVKCMSFETSYENEIVKIENDRRMNWAQRAFG